MTAIFIVLAVAIAGVLLYAATRPDTFSVSRSAEINAPAERIFAFVNDLADHMRWSPFARDPKIQNVVGTPSAGAGARVDFSGSCAGSLSIVEARPASRIAMRLVMLKPMQADNDVEFSFMPQGDATRVTWAMRGRQPYLGKLMSVFINCDKMVGRQFEQGLADLKTLSEQSALQAAE